MHVTVSRVTACEHPSPDSGRHIHRNSTHVDIKITYSLFVAVCLIVAMRRAHIGQPEVECDDLRLGSAVLVRRELQLHGSLLKN